MGASWDKPVDVKSKHFDDFKKKLPSLGGKVVAITGCTSGTGLVAAKACAELGATVLMLNRKSERAEAALQKVKEAAPNSKIVSIDCDLMDFESVKRAASEISAAYADGLDILVNNAGIMATHDKATKDGYDMQMQTNHLSHFLLTRELLPLLEKAAAKNGEARIVNHSSLARKNRGNPLSEQHLGKNGGNLGGDDWGFFMDGPRWVRYQNSKLANVVFTRALHARLTAKESKVKVLVAAPGVSATNLMSSTVTGEQSQPGGLTWLLAPLYMLFIQVRLHQTRQGDLIDTSSTVTISQHVRDPIS
jgi:NAD(P)-dependent dehydrogenase (short-subunit alcohol dehydrogenase family)